jgi:hypothetical protein
MDVRHFKAPRVMGNPQKFQLILNMGGGTVV